MIEGRLYDGITGHPHQVTAAIEGGCLILSQDNGWTDSVDANELKRLDGDAGSLRLGRAARPGWRLILPANAEEQLAGLLGKRETYGRWIDRIGLIRALIVGGVLTAAVVTVGYVAPQWIAPHVPMSWERNVGSAIVGDFGDMRCRNADGQRALEALVERVSPGATKGPDGIKIAALDVPIFNAAALPGGYIVVLKPAIAETNPDALAGVLAHEVAHVHRRHVAEALIREFGIGALIRLFAGDLGANTEQLVSLSYTRRNEADADADAIQMLKRAGISPQPTAQLFAKLAREQGERTSYAAQFLQSHPLSAGRATRFAASFDPHARYAPALDGRQWAQLVNICASASRGRQGS